MSPAAICTYKSQNIHWRTLHPSVAMPCLMPHASAADQSPPHSRHISRHYIHQPLRLVNVSNFAPNSQLDSGPDTATTRPRHDYHHVPSDHQPHIPRPATTRYYVYVYSLRFLAPHAPLSRAIRNHCSAELSSVHCSAQFIAQLSSLLRSSRLLHGDLHHLWLRRRHWPRGAVGPSRA